MFGVVALFVKATEGFKTLLNLKGQNIEALMNCMYMACVYLNWIFFAKNNDIHCVLFFFIRFNIHI